MYRLTNSKQAIDYINTKLKAKNVILDSIECDIVSDVNALTKMERLQSEINILKFIKQLIV